MERDNERTEDAPQGQDGETRSTVDAERERREALERAQAERPDLVAGTGRSTEREGLLDPDERVDRR